jgi:HTH-type transcriptional regulator, glycine betaine synthesis regulator
MNSVYTVKSASVKSNTGAGRLKPAEVEAIQLFVRVAAVLGQPRSVAEIYGLLFMSEKPLTMDTLIERLAMSKGSASQGLKYLQDLGAVRTVYVAAERRTHYEAVAELRKLAGRFLNQQIQAHFESGGSLLDGIAAQTASLPEEQRKHALERLELLRRWERTGRNVLPLVLTMLGGA